MGRLHRWRFGAQSTTGCEPSAWSTIFTETLTEPGSSRQSRLIRVRNTSLPHLGRAS